VLIRKLVYSSSRTHLQLALLPEDFLFPFGGLDFRFLANSEALEILTYSTVLKLVSSLCSQTETHTQI